MTLPPSFPGPQDPLEGYYAPPELVIRAQNARVRARWEREARDRDRNRALAIRALAIRGQSARVRAEWNAPNRTVLKTLRGIDPPAEMLVELETDPPAEAAAAPPAEITPQEHQVLERRAAAKAQGMRLHSYTDPAAYEECQGLGCEQRCNEFSLPGLCSSCSRDVDHVRTRFADFEIEE